MAKTETLGLGNLKANFAKLRDEMKTRTARAMVVAGGGSIKKKAKVNAQGQGLVLTGALVKNIVIKREPSAGEGVEQVNLGVRHGRNLTKKQKSSAKLAVNKKGRIVKQYQDDPYYWRFPEFGTKHQKATPFLAPALEQGKEDAIAAMGKRLQKELDKAGKA